MKQSFSDFEGLQGIPGNIGGGIFMNSSCYGYELTKYVKEIVSIDLSVVQNFKRKKMKHYLNGEVQFIKK